MHSTSFWLMSKFVEEYLSNKSGLSVCDIGSSDMNGSYKPLFMNHKYIGMEQGKNVDVISNSLYEFPFPDETFDVVISGQTIEHVKDLHRWIKEIARITKQGGLISIIGPVVWKEHRYPVDCWRVLPDGMRFLFEEVAGCKVLSTTLEKIDCMGAARK